MAIFI